MTLAEILAAMKAHGNKQEILDGIREDADLKNAIYQVAYDDGHGAATNVGKSAKTRMENELQAAKDAKDKAEADLAKLKKENPDAAALHDQYGKTIKEKDDEITRLKTEFTAKERDARKTDLRTKYLAELERLRVDPDKREAMAEADLRLMQVDDAGERILQPGKSTAFAGDIDAQIKSLAAERFKTVPKTLILANNVKAGSGDGAVGETSDAPLDEKKARFQKAREDVKKKYGGRTAAAVTTDAAAPLPPEQELNRRMGRIGAPL